MGLRVKRTIDVDAIIRALRLDEKIALDDTIESVVPEVFEDPNEIIVTEMFTMLRPGNERICAILRSDGLTYKSIGEIMGLSEGQVKTIITNMRHRLSVFDKKQR